MEQRNKHGLTRRIGLAGVLGLAGLVLSGCTVAPPENGFFNFLRMGWPKGITPESKEMGNLWVWVWVVAWIIGIIMWAIFIYAIFAWNGKRREKKGYGEFPKQLQYNCLLYTSPSPRDRG